MLQNLTNLLYRPSIRCYALAAAAVKHKRQRKTPQQQQQKNPAFITCKRSEFNLLVPEKTASKFGSIPLASKGWLHYKAKNDYFTINATETQHEMQAQLKDLQELLNSNQLKLHPQLVENLSNELDITQLTQIQADGMPKIYDGQHMLIAAETGCGKTLTYLVPILQQILERQSRNVAAGGTTTERKMNTPLAVIITPGRELATQIGNITEQLCTNTGLKVKTVLGGNTKQLMLNPDFDEVDVLVATMGALSKLVTTGIYRMGQVRHVVLDEADTLLDDSFTEKLVKLLQKFAFHKNHLQDDFNVGTQLVLASATMPTNIEEQLQRVIDVQTLHQVVSPNLHKLMPHVQQKFVRMSKANRPANLLTLVKTELEKKRPIIVFSNKSTSSDFVSIFLNNASVNCLNLNGDMLMKIRLGRFEQFQNGECDVLSTTDVGSRGLDTRRARHVINFDFPLHVSDYIHRAGRIGRVGHTQKCFVTNFISSRREVDVVQRIEHAARTGGLLPNVNANIKGLINQRILNEMKEAGLTPPTAALEEMF